MYVGLDVGGTHIRVCTSSSLENPFLISVLELQTTNDFLLDVQHIHSTITHITQEKIKAIAIGIAGQLDENDMLWEAPNLSSWVKKPIKKLFEDKYQCPVFLANDAVVAGLGEEQFGIFKEQNFSYVIWGTGIGGSTITHKGSLPFVQQLDWDSHFPAWEKDCGGRQIELRFKKHAQDLSPKEWEDILQKFILHTKEFIQKTRSGKIVFGGGIAFHNQEKMRVVQTQLQEKARIAVSTLEEKANLLGTFCLLHNTLLT